MSLLNEYASDYYVMTETRTPDGAGGYTTSWVPGRKVKLILRFDSHSEQRRAEKDDVSSSVTFLCQKDSGIKYHDVLKNCYNSALVFRATAPSDDFKVPTSSALNLTSFTAERWELT